MNRLLRTIVVSTFCFAPVCGFAIDEPAKVEAKQDGDKPVEKPDEKPAEKPLVKIELEKGDTAKLEAATEKALAKAAPRASAVAIDPEVRKVLDEVRDAYAKLKSLELAGTISANYDIGGQKQANVDTFTATYRANNQFRHEMKDDMVAGSTGEKIYAYQAAQNLYLLKDAPKDRVASSELPEPLNKLIPAQNPSLALAISKDAGEQLVADATAIKKLPDVTVDGKAFTVLQVSSPLAEMTYHIDPQTHLLSHAVADQKAYLQKVGQNDVKVATITYGYTKTLPDAAVNDTQFAWTPPANARDLSTVASAKSSGDDEAASKLEGKKAPDFTLTDLSGKEVALSAQKGNVVVVDFWATWCGPCIQSLPHLNKLYEDKKGDGLKVIAVSVDQDKAKVPPFVTDKKLTFTVVIDSDESKTAEKYAVQGIPQTVVIGKDGKVRKVFIGFGPGSEDKLRAEVEAAMKQ